MSQIFRVVKVVAPLFVSAIMVLCEGAGTFVPTLSAVTYLLQHIQEAWAKNKSTKVSCMSQN